MANSGGNWFSGLVIGSYRTVASQYLYRKCAASPRREFEWWPLGVMKQYGGLASLAGVSLPGAKEGSRAQLGIQLMKSRAFIGDFVTRRDIMPTLMAVDTWDARSGNVVYDPEIYDAVTKKWVRDVEPPKLPEPSAQERIVRLLRT